ncbi:MAG: CoA transferase [Hyphomicrobiaceae bacterium]|nr:MAG: CoA transferase [Hyphomicrobiaceae bacterium]
MSAALEGTKVIDMGWLMVGPESARYLADLGAQVVKAESSVRIDPLRTLGPFKDGRSGHNRSLSYHAINAGKRSVLLDLKHPRGIEAFLRLVRWADVLIESFAAGVIDSLGLSFEELRQQNARLIMVSTSLLGRTGPEAKGTSGTGITGSAFAGATNLLGWPDRAPCGPYGPWTDSVAPRFIVASIIAALRRRRRTGEGCYLDAAQAECGIQFLLPAYYDYAVNGRAPERRGAAGSPLRCPSGVYRCAGEDRWVAIDASCDAQWQAFRRVVGEPLARGELDTLVGRLRHREEIDGAIGAWTEGKTSHEIEGELQAVGVAAHVVSTSQDLADDEDLHRESYFRSIHDPEVGDAITRGPTFRLHRTPHVPTKAGPRLGDSSREILMTMAGYSASEIDALERDGAIR